MSVDELVSTSARPYASQLREVQVSGNWMQSRNLMFNMEAQTESNWCWAAASTSVSHFYWPLSTWTQCDVANAELAQSDCCNSPAPGACNVPWYLDRALTRTNNFVSVSGPATFATVRGEIDAGRPVGARIGWSGGGGHFVCIYGYAFAANLIYFDIDDPIYGKSHLLMSDFATQYQGSGSWTHTYITKGSSPLPIIPTTVNDSILKKIWEARPLLRLKTNFAPERAEESVAETSAALGLAHRIVVVGLDALAEERDATGGVIGTRIYEILHGTPVAFYDVAEGDATIRQMSAAAQHLEPFGRALEVAVSIADDEQADAELKLYRVPGLNFEALWLSHSDNQADYLVPITGVGPLPAAEPVLFIQAVRTLREAARTLLRMDDDTTGA